MHEETEDPGPKDARLSLSKRLQAALRILLGRGDNAVACSFCGRTRASGETIVAGPGVAICGTCAFTALDQVATRDAPPPQPPLVEVCLMPLLEPACLLPAGRATLAADLARAAGTIPCALSGWSYGCNSRTGDHLVVRVACGEGTDNAPLPDRFRAAFLQA